MYIYQKFKIFEAKTKLGKNTELSDFLKFYKY